jgi:UDP-2,4-diacetamido-2,4,6-trideoxy-beta-L-altropyranose hydrolase
MKTIMFRVDSSFEMGTGHVMRCLTLANELKKKGAEVSFICRDLLGNLGSYLMKKGFHVWLLPNPKIESTSNPSFPYSSWLKVDWRTDAYETLQILRKVRKIDCLIIDHYSIDKKWEDIVKNDVEKIFVIDDLANRPHHCHVLLDQNITAHKNKYIPLLPENCDMLLGTSYALLRPEFREAKRKMYERDGKINRILVFFGGSDPTEETMKTLQVLQKEKFTSFRIDIVVGEANQHKEMIKKKCEELSNVTFYCQVENMAELMSEADLSIGAGGSSTWERCYLGLPTIVIATAKNQVEITEFVRDTGAIYYLGESEHVTDAIITKAVMEMVSNPLLVKKMSEKARLLMGEDRFNDIIVRIMEGENDIFTRIQVT